MLSSMKMMYSLPMTLPLFLAMYWLRGRGIKLSRIPLLMPTPINEMSINLNLKLKKLIHQILNQPIPFHSHQNHIQLMNQKR
jgi:hypothetical protein